MLVKKNSISSKKKILHILAYDDKFTFGYVNFMKKEMPAWEHFFIIVPIVNRDGLIDCDNIYYINRFFLAQVHSKIKKIIKDAEQIIVSGVFSSHVMVSFFSRKAMNKTFLHFWGNDFYSLRNSPDSIRGAIKNKLKIHCIKKCAGLIFLIEGEYNKFLEITHIENRNYVAPMPGDPCKRIRNADYRTKHGNIVGRTIANDVVKILVGNSATSTNHHIEVFEMLKKFPLDKIEIYCPLSYGNEEYREIVLKEGVRILGEAFHPVLEFMNCEDYRSFLAGMDIGIFNNDRQQAMGNISIMLGLGKKIYMRNDTSMWKKYIDEGYILYPFSSVENIRFEKFILFDETAKKKNEMIDDTRDTIQIAKEKWSLIFNINCAC